MKSKEAIKMMESALVAFMDKYPPLPSKPAPPRKLSPIDLLWDSMTEDEKLLAYAKAKLRDAEKEDKFRKRRTRAVANFWYEAKTMFEYGG